MKKYLLISLLIFLAASCQKVATYQEPVKIVEQELLETPVATATPVNPEILGQSTSTPVDVPKPIQIKTVIKKVDNSEAIERVEQETENVRIAKEQAEEKLRQVELERQQQEEVKRLQAIEQALLLKKQAEEQRIKEQIAKEAEALKQELVVKQALLARMKTECDNPLDALRQQIIDVKSKYFADLKELDSRPGQTTLDHNSAYIKLIDDANTKIQNLSNRIDQTVLQCKINFGN